MVQPLVRAWHAAQMPSVVAFTSSAFTWTATEPGLQDNFSTLSDADSNQAWNVDLALRAPLGDRS